MEIKIKVPVVSDSWNSNPTDEIEFRIGDDTVSFSIDEDREITVEKKILIRFLKFLEFDDSMDWPEDDEKEGL